MKRLSLAIAIATFPIVIAQAQQQPAQPQPSAICNPVWKKTQSPAWDEADFANFGPSGSPRGARLRIVHIGSINAEFRDPSPLFEAIARMVREGRLATSECDIAFIGGGPYSETGEVRARERIVWRNTAQHRPRGERCYGLRAALPPPPCKRADQGDKANLQDEAKEGGHAA